MQAIILAAGMGKRLKKYTASNTKCMVKVNGVPLIDRMLSQIERVGVDRIVIVVGYEGQKLIDHINGLDIGTRVEYVNNPIYDKTNNIYSLALAEQYMVEDDTLLFESDLIFEDSVLESLVSDPRPTLALVDKYQSWMDGTCVILSDNDTIVKFVPGNKFEYADSDSYYKTVNIYKFSKDFSENVYIPFLKAYTTALGKNEYYEQVLRVLTILDDPQIYAKRLNGEKWYEIDDVQDLDIAESMFVGSSEEYAKKIQGRYGGYWRYPYITDFCYPQNYFFPPQRAIDEIKAGSEHLIKNYPSGQSIIKLLASKDTSIDEEHVLITNGIEESVYILLSAIEGKIGVVSPTNEYILDVLGERALIYKSEEEVSYSVSDIVEYFGKDKISAILITNPNYHTGYTLADDDIETIINWAKDKGIYAIIDETYIDFVHDSTSMMNDAVLKKHGNLIVLKNLSVPYGVSGLRLACIAISDEALLKNCQEKIPCWNIDAYAEFFLQIIGKYQKQFRSSVEQCIEERTRMEDIINEIEGVSVVRSNACFVLIKLLNGKSAKHVVNILLYRYNILVKDASVRISDSGNQYIKCAIRSRDENDRFIEALRKAIGFDTRVRDISQDIDDTKTFFENRIQKELPHRYNYVIYQDANPGLAIERDIYEKNKISPFMNLSSESLILDIGCGVARWGDYFSEHLKSGKYVGVDFSHNLLEIAKKQFCNDERYVFAQGPFQELENIIANNDLPSKYDIILINGVLMYINDSELDHCMKTVNESINSGGVIYIKESVGVDNRFTLNHFYSSEMSADYSAIYRSIQQYKSLFDNIFPSTEYRDVNHGFMWDENLTNRSETTSYYWIFQKI